MPSKKRPDFRSVLVTPDSNATATPRQPDPRFQAFRDRFERQAFALERGQQIEKLVGATAAAWVALAREVGRCAPIDENPGGAEARRHRYYSTGLYVRRAAYGRHFTPLPAFVDSAGNVFTTYMQPAGANRDYERERRFEPLPDELLKHAGLVALIELCFRACPASLYEAGIPDLLKVGLHLISLQPHESEAAVSSPNRAHFDGEFVTFIVMIERENVIGGGSLIAKRSYADFHPDDIPDQARLFEATLTEPMDMLATDDRRISHYVYPVFARKNLAGRRTVLLIDFTPLVPQMSNERLARERPRRPRRLR